ncbi:hypothetical protein RBB50_009048 [Rhinocladiella similis]
MEKHGPIFTLTSNDELMEVQSKPGHKEYLTVDGQDQPVAAVPNDDSDIETSSITLAESSSLAPHATFSQDGKTSETATTSLLSHRASSQEQDASDTDSASLLPDLTSNQDRKVSETATPPAVADETPSQGQNASERGEKQETACPLPDSGRIPSIEMSPLKSSYVQTRLKQFKSEESALAQKLEEAKQRLQQRRENVEKLHVNQRVEIGGRIDQRAAVAAALKKYIALARRSLKLRDW